MCRRSPKPSRASISPAGGSLAAPTGVPAPISQRVNNEMNAILKDPAVVGAAARASGFVSPAAAEPWSRRSDYVQAQHAAWGTLVQEIGLKPE